MMIDNTLKSSSLTFAPSESSQIKTRLALGSLESSYVEIYSRITSLEKEIESLKNKWQNEV